MALTTKSNKSRAQLLALAAIDRVNGIISRYDRAAKSSQNSPASLPLVLFSENSLTVAGLATLFSAATVESLYWSSAKTMQIYGFLAKNELDLTKVMGLQRLLATRLQSFIVESDPSDLGLPGFPQESVLSLRQKNSLRKALDFAVTFSVNNGIIQAGVGTFERKQVIGTIDGNMTDLCRNRMNGQVRKWNEPYLDPVSGSKWMQPPFIGRELPQNEIFHSCRRISVPRTN